LRKERDSATRRAITRACNVGFVRQPRYLFSDLSKCGVGGGWVHHGRLAAPVSLKCSPSDTGETALAVLPFP